jgi:hypothetical protein
VDGRDRPRRQPDGARSRRSPGDGPGVRSPARA